MDEPACENKAGMKTQEDCPTTKSRGKERLEDYSTSVACIVRQQM